MSDQISEQATRLRDSGARTLTGVISDSGGVMRAKTVPAGRIESFARHGMGASLTWPQFCVDNAVPLTPEVSVIGDLRLTADLDTARVLDNGIAWAVADVRDQDGERSPYCWRDVLRRQVDALAALGIDALVGHELEFALTDWEGRPLGDEFGWPCYGAGVYSELAVFGAEICERLTAAGVVPEQIHAEYGLGQCEMSLPPRDPITSADNVLLARSIIGRVAREHRLRASFSPVPFAGGSGNGAHLHLSMSRAGRPLFSGGDAAEGLTSEAASAVGGILAGLPSAMAILAGTVVSGERIHAGGWSGAWACWGTENREAALRYLAPTYGNPHGANLEVKCVDAGANPYLSSGLVLGLARKGIEDATPVPAPVAVDPADLSDAERSAAGVALLPSTAADRLAGFEASTAVREILGAPLHAAALAMRRHEATIDAAQDLHRTFRFAWSA
ncbi:glutamine synthetase family protein [Propionicicella superfundia]|uniref:glutamine synthetase family protein n=1 Tax=Propionicicella superfundia TaxID=348582 RepID=UPI000403F548|nr:glutamine synthetase family protein [Propionicicella superfundia]